MTSNMEKWGREAARKRYGSTRPNMVAARADGGAVVYDKAMRGWLRTAKPGPRVGPFPMTHGELEQSKMPSGPQDTYASPSEEDRKQIKELSEDK